MTDLIQTCPNVLAHAPRTHRGVLLKLAAESTVAVWLTMLRTQNEQVIHFAHAVAKLRWSNPSLVRLVRNTAHAETKQTMRKLPDVCNDMKAWVASGYTKVPSATARLLKAGTGLLTSKHHVIRVYDILNPHEAAGGVILRRLRPYEDTVNRHKAAYVMHEEGGLSSSYIKIVGDASRQIARGLGFETHPGSAAEEPIISPPPAVKQAGGRELQEFEMGSRVAVTSGCLACHRIADQGNSGPGPNLTHVGSKLSPQEIEHVLMSPSAPMPSFKNLPRAKLEALVAFLSLLK